MWSFEFFRSSELMLPGAVFGATYSPGFSYDLATWRLVVDDEGNLFQDVETRDYLPTAPLMVQHYRAEHRCYHVVVGREAVDRFVSLADAVGFWTMDAKYDYGVTDMAHFGLSVRVGDREHTIKAYAADYQAHLGNAAMKNFMRLWDVLHERAPFRSDS